MRFFVYLFLKKNSGNTRHPQNQSQLIITIRGRYRNKQNPYPFLPSFPHHTTNKYKHFRHTSLSLESPRKDEQGTRTFHRYRQESQRSSNQGLQLRSEVHCLYLQRCWSGNSLSTTLFRFGEEYGVSTNFCNKISDHFIYSALS